jgi:amino acid transporter
VIGFSKWQHNPFVPVTPPHQPLFSVFGVGLAIGLWLYSGYEQCSTVAEEVENPRRSYPLALAIVVPMSIAVYFLPTVVSLAALGNWQSWHTGYFPDAAQLIGGPWLGSWMTIAAMITNLSLLNATVLTSTRMPFAMAEDGYLPSVLTGKHRRYGTPWIAIMASGAIYGLLAVHSLVQLISIYNWLRVATTVLTVLAAWQLRRKRPELPRSFVIPGGRLGLAGAVIAVIIMSAVALLGSDRYGLRWGPVALAAGPVIYWLIAKSRKIQASPRVT